MKKAYKLVICLIFVLCLGVGINLTNPPKAYAEAVDPSVYTSVQKEYFDSVDGEYKPKENAPAFQNGSAIFLQDGQRVAVRLGEGEYSGKITSLTYRILANDLTFDNQASAALEIYGLSIPTLGGEKAFELIIDPAVAKENNGTFNYGKYTIEFSYYFIGDNLEYTQTTSTVSLYILNYDNYFNNTRFFNLESDLSLTKFFSNYSTEGLPYLYYNYQYLNLKVVRSFKGLTTTTTLTYKNGALNISSLDENNSASENHNVVVASDGEEKTATITFRNLGIYYLTFEVINSTGQNEVITSFYEEQPVTMQNVYVYGYQAYFTSQNGLKEFKLANSKTPYLIDETAYSADITSFANANLSNINNINIDNIAKTNQAPIYFETNAIIAESSCYKYYETENAFANNTPTLEVSEYTGTPISKAGIYFVKLDYTYSSHEAGVKTQYFLFRITNDAPVVEIYTSSEMDPTIKTYLSDDEFTYKDVNITKSALGVFDSESTLTVFKDTSFNGNYDAGTLVQENNVTTFTETAKYKVVLNYGNTSQKGFTSYFTIDKSPISNIEFKNLYKDIGTNYRAGSILEAPYLTNNPVALSWSEKASGAVVTAEYKFFPTKYSSGQENALTPDELKTLYESQENKYSIPSSYVLSYNGGTMPVAEYANTNGKSIFLESDAIKNGGLYIFHIYDNTGAEGQYFAIFIDETPNNIISVNEGSYNLVKNNEVTTKDAIVYFGDKKLIKIDYTINGDWDEWLNAYVESNSVTYKNQKYLTVDINNRVYLSKDGLPQTYHLLTGLNAYGYTIQAMNNGVANESEYIFYTIAESTNNYSIYAKDSFNYYKENHTATHTIRFSTDNSRMLVYYIENGATKFLQQTTTVNSTNSKTNYYQPTAQNTLANAGTKETLKFSYNIKPSNLLEVESIELKYYAFEKDETNTTYKFNLTNPTSSINIYKKGSENWGTEVLGELNTYVYDVNLETYNNSSTRTKAGRYEIIRTYTENSALSENDPKERKLVFIVDRNGIISEPEIQPNGDFKYYLGSGIQLQIINRFGTSYYDEDTLHFYDIFYASKLSQNSLVPVVTTNFLPVTIYIPAYKYGYISSNENSYPTFNIENSIVKFLSEGSKDPYYSNYKLSAVVEHYKGSVLSNTYILNKNLVGYNFLTTESSGNSIVSFNEEGFYRVTITSGAGDVFSFVFEIQYSSPEFDLLNIDNTRINSDLNGIYYTNQSKVRISWEDSPNEYLARINKEAIVLNVNGKKINIPSSLIRENGQNRYYVDIDLSASNIQGYYNDSEIAITLQFNGEQEDYNNSEYFSKTIILKVDLQAPLYNITNLIKTTGLTFQDLRAYADTSNKYNISQTSGMLRYFAFNVDKTVFEQLILAPGATGNDYFKTYYRLFLKNGVNTKYVAGNTYETDITASDLTGQTDGIIWSDTGESFARILDNYSNTYIELIEEDFAGNRTVFTIYLSNIENNANDVMMTYNSSTGAEEQTLQELTFADATKEIEVYSKYSFNLESLRLFVNDPLSNLTWQVISTDSDIFIKSPYSNGKFYSLKENNKNIELTEYTLKEITTLYSSSSSQTLKILSHPVLGEIDINVYVLNKALEVYTLAEVMDSNEFEGLLIKLPGTNAAENNVLYAKKLLIKANMGEIFETTYEIEGDYLKQEIEELPSMNNLEMSYVTYRGARYFQVQIKGNININDYFVYTIIDNFGAREKVVHIYGQTQIEEPITGDGYITQSYNENGNLVNYASENITYRYDTTIYDRVHVFVGLSGEFAATKNYTILKNENTYKVVNYGTDILADVAEYGNYFSVSVVQNVFAIEMKQAGYDFGVGVYGGDRAFVISLVPKADFEDIGDQDVYFEIYNALPNALSLISKSSAVNVTSILSGNSAYAGEVVINYINSKLKFDYELLLADPEGNITALTDGMLISEDGTYRIIINYLGVINGCSKSFEFTIANSQKFIYSVATRNSDGTFKNVEATGAAFSYVQNGSTITIATHYIVNGEYEIILNGNLYLTSTLENVDPIDDYTYIYTISNIKSPEANSGLITEFYSAKIAISVIPDSGEILKRLVHYGGNIKEQTDNLLTLSTPSITPYVTTKDEYDAGIRIAWSKYNLIKENIITAEVYYGDIDGAKFNAKIEEINNLNSITLKTSGTYYIRFVDKAGNTQLFGTYKDNEFFTIKYLSSVIFEVQEETPINYAIYDKNVVVTVPDITLGYYDVNAKPKISVELNGEAYAGYNKLSQYSWEFSDAGLYKVYFSAKIDEKEIYEAPIYFTILSSKESRLTYTYTGYSNYYIEDIKLDGVSVNSRLANINNGDIYVVDGQNYLKNIVLHYSDRKTGNGYWTFVINTDNEFNQKFEFTVWINRADVPIQISVPNGTTTNEEILVEFNTQNVLTHTGDCILKISGFDDMVLTQEKLDAGELDEVYSITISNAGSYYVEITSMSGQLLYTSYVVKTEPLNVISIIIIVVAVIVVGAGIVLFVLLRRKMKIR